MLTWSVPMLMFVVGLQATSDPSQPTSPPQTITMEPYTRLHPGRHVCTVEKEREGGGSVKRFEAYKRPTYQSYSTRCQDRICRGVRVVYETAYRDVDGEPTYRCCPGWAQMPKTSLGCNSAVCSQPCLNGGTCSTPDVCTCPSGFTGPQCEEDIDECEGIKPCSHTCSNTHGSFKCSCRQGFKLAPDLRSCLRRGKNKTLDGKLDIEFIARKVAKLEKMMRKNSKYELQTELSENPSNDELQASVDTLQKRMETLSRQQQEAWRRTNRELEELRPLKARLDTIETRLAHCSWKGPPGTQPPWKSPTNRTMNSHKSNLYLGTPLEFCVKGRCKDHQIFTRMF